MNLKREFQVGILFLVAVLLLIIFSFAISHLEIFHKYYYLNVIFESVMGLKPGDPVQVSGLELGVVYSLEYLENTRIKVVLKLRQKIRLYEDYEIRIEESSMIGGNYVYIAPGTPGKPIVPTETDLNGRITLSGLKELGEFVANSKKDVKSLLQDTFKIIDQIRKGEGSLGKLINDEALYINLKDSSESLKKITKQVEEGKGLLGKVLFDERLSDQVSRAGDAAAKVLEPVVKTQIFAGLETKYYAEAETYISRAFIRIAPRENKYWLVGLSFLSLDKEGVVDFEDKLSRDKDQIFWKPDLQVAYRFPLGRETFLTFRTGLLEGKLGGGLDLDLPITMTGIIPLTLTVEGRDAYNSIEDEDIDENLDGAMWRAYATVKIGRHFRFYAGRSRLFDDEPEFMAGFSFEYLDEDIKNLFTLIGLSR